MSEDQHVFKPSVDSGYYVSALNVDVGQMYERRYIATLFWKKALENNYPSVKAMSRTSDKPLKTLLENINGNILAHYQNKKTHRLLVEASGVMIELDLDIQEGGNSYSFTLAANSTEEIDALEKKIIETLPIVEDDDSGKISMSFSYFSETNGATDKRRKIDTPLWNNIRDNYPCDVATKLDQLTATEIPTTSGKMILFHGSPGTGKTHAIRALVRKWAPWCKSSYIVDPESFFSSPSYMFEMVLDSEEDEHESFMERIGYEFSDNIPDDNKKKWSLFIVEDVDELISSDAKQRTGQSLSRLLNLVDGLVGQGLQIIFLMTTNEPINKIHPALARPGRCLANIEFKPLSAEESIEWCNNHNLDSSDIKKPQSIAELYSRLNNKPVIEVEQQEKRMGFR